MDLGVRDRDDPGVRGDGDLGVGRVEQLAGEAAAAVVVAARADARLATDEAPEMLRLGQRPLRAGRGDLQRVLLADLGSRWVTRLQRSSETPVADGR